MDSQNSTENLASVSALTSSQRILRRIWLEDNLETFTKLAAYYRNVGPDIALPKLSLWKFDDKEGSTVLK